MGFKRKRDVDVSPFSTESFTASTPEAQSPTPLPDGQSAMDVDSFPRVKSQEAWNDRGLGGELGSRTRKRFRDGRPDEDVVQKKTLRTLFEAQRVQRMGGVPLLPEVKPLPETVFRNAMSKIHTPQKPQKSTLHSFWNISAPPVQSYAAKYHVQESQLLSTSARIMNAPRCDDCDSILQGNVGDELGAEYMDLDMDMGGSGHSIYACVDCGKNVCSTCAVVSNARHCLQCATAARTSGRWW